MEKKQNRLYMPQVFFCLLALLLTGSALASEDVLRWQLDSAGGIVWKVRDRLPHSDHIEMSGQQISVVLRYGVDSAGAFTLDRSLVWPMLRFKPNKTGSHLNRHFNVDVMDLIQVNGMKPQQERVEKIILDGKMEVYSSYSVGKGRKMEKNALSCRRVCFPSSIQPAYCEEYVLKNSGKENLTLEVPVFKLEYDTDVEKGIYGSYRINTTLSNPGIYTLSPGGSLKLDVVFSARKIGESVLMLNVEAEKQMREALIREWWTSLVLETPDPVLNRMFAFAKLRGAESIYKTKGGFMHGPGGETYYAAIWANDQAEYINPFFPFLGYETGNASAFNSFMHFARFMNPAYKPIPSSIISEGTGIWHGAGDRGDGAMIAYGAARYALACGDREKAEKLWPLIEWCLEFCKRKLTDEGVVASDSDELEKRFPAGKANLCTSSLYYDALHSAVFLGKALGKPAKVLQQYAQEADLLEKNIENYFGAKVEGFDTYRYYKENDVLRAWICIPLTVGIYNRTEGTAAALFSPRLWTNDGLLTQAGTSTYWDRSTLYALRGVIAAGKADEGIDYLKYYSSRRLLGEHVPYAIEAWPEGSQRHLSAESGLYCRIYTEGFFGIRPTGLKSFVMTPRLPQKWDYMRLKKIKAFDSDFDVEITRKAGKIEVSIYQHDRVLQRKTIRPGDSLAVRLK